MQSSLVKSIADLDSKETLEIVHDLIRCNEDPQAILASCQCGMDEVGKRFATGEYFIADLMFVAAIFGRIMEQLGPELRKSGYTQKAGKIVIATVKDDIHDIGKNLVASMLDIGGFEVLDLGVDVAPETVCEKIREHVPDIVALSCLLSTSIASVEKTIGVITAAGLRDKVKIIVGGNPMSAKLAGEIGAHAYADDANEAVKKCRELMEA